MKTHYNLNLIDIAKFAKIIVSDLKGGEVFALKGQLGSGKTTFVQAVGKELKIKHKITSPTFSLMNRYKINIDGQPKHLYHLDLYRTETIKEIKALGLMEFLGSPEAIVFIEWAEKMKKILPKKTIWISFTGKNK